MDSDHRDERITINEQGKSSADPLFFSTLLDGFATRRKIPRTTWPALSRQPGRAFMHGWA
jgi:hypothetical protein